MSRVGVAPRETVIEDFFEITDVWRGLGVSERLTLLRAAHWTATTRRDPDELGSSAIERLARWRSQRTLDGRGALHDPTAIYQCSEAEFSAVLDGSSPVLVESPPWALALAGAWTRSDADCIEIGPVDRDPARAFLPLLGRLIADAIDAVRTRAIDLGNSEIVPPFSPDVVIATLAETLVNRLSGLIGRTAVVELHAARLNEVLTGDSTQRFESFVARMSDHAESREIVRRAPVLGRLAVEIASSWVDASCDFLEALASDWPRLSAAFG